MKKGEKGWGKVRGNIFLLQHTYLLAAIHAELMVESEVLDLKAKDTGMRAVILVFTRTLLHPENFYRVHIYKHTLGHKLTQYITCSGHPPQFILQNIIDC